jgi:hypothetical protein
MKKLNIQRDLNSRAAISEKRRRTQSVAKAPVEPVKNENHGTSEETPGREDYPQSGAEPRKASRKVRKAEGDV